MTKSAKLYALTKSNIEELISPCLNTFHVSSKDVLKQNALGNVD